MSGVPAACGPGVVALLNGDPFLALQDAWDAAGDDALIEICPGVWEESVYELLGSFRRRVVRSASGDPSDTILIGDGVRWGFYVEEAWYYDIEFMNLTFIDFNGSIVMDPFNYSYIEGTRLLIRNCVFESSYQAGQSAVRAFADFVEISESQFHNTHEALAAGSPLDFGKEFYFNNNELINAGFWASYFKYSTTSDSIVEVHSNSFAGSSFSIGWFGDAHHTATLSNNVFTEHVEDAFARGPYSGAALTVRVDDGAQVDLDISDSLFDANFGYDAAHVELERDPFEEAGVSYLDATFTRTTFWRGGWAAGWIPDFDSPGEDGVIVGSAIGLNSHNRSLDLHFEDVDFGTGPTANYARTIDLCPERREGMYTGSYSYPTSRQSCPW